MRLRNWSSASPNEPLRQETVQADYTTAPAQTANGGAIITTRDAVTLGFGIEQVPEAARNELVRRSMQHLLPTGADTTPPTVVGFKYPTNLSTATPRDPVELELTAFDERGDMDRVDLYADGVLHSSVPVYPFQFRYTPPASAVGSVVKLTAVAVDAAGNRATRDLYVNVLAGDTPPASPVAVAPPTLLGSPVVGETLGCISGGFVNAPTKLEYAWLRNGAVIAGATSASYTLISAELGRAVACRVTATNAHGSGDATSETLVVSNPTPAPAPITATPAPVTLAAPVPAPAPAAKTPAAAATKYKASCKRSKSKKAIVCNVTSSSKAKFTSKIRLQGKKKTATASKTSKAGKVKLTLRSRKAFKKGQKVVLTVKSGKKTKVFTAKTR